MISLDTETTGLDFAHGARPYLVTTARLGDGTTYWRWPVDPLTRKVHVPTRDRVEICDLVNSTGEVVLQNAKFDVTALYHVGLERWPWEKTHDTLVGAHLLYSNRRKSLDALALDYLGVDIRPAEVALEAACKKARNYCRRFRKDWAIASPDKRDDMPSVKETSWKLDGWLPKLLAEDVGVDRLSEHYGEDVSGWLTVLEDYANTDSEVTLLVWQRVKAMIAERGLWDIYLESARLPRCVYLMERRGVTLVEENLERMLTEYAAEFEQCGRVCEAIALRDYGYVLDLPRGPINKNLTTFCFEVMGLPVVKYTDTGNPSLDSKVAIPEYLATLDRKTGPWHFLHALARRRKRGTAVGYMESYKSFWRPVPGSPGYYRLHPGLNQTSSDTLRLTSENPNEQNIAKQPDEEGNTVRHCFGPLPGREWWSMDFKNLEIRIPAYESGERELIDLLEREDDPPYYGSIHMLNFHTVFPEVWGKVLQEVGPDKVGAECKKRYKATHYQDTKNGGFAKQYGGGRAKVDATFRRAGAYDLIEARFSRLAGLNARVIAYARKHGYVETLPDRQVDPRRGYPLLCSRTEYGDVLPTVPLNYRVQGTAMWLSRRAWVKVQDFYDRLNAGGAFAGRRWPGGYYLILQVHDELVSDVPSGKGKGVNPWDYNRPVVDEVRRLIASCGEDLIPRVPTPVGMEYHEYNWGEGVAL